MPIKQMPGSGKVNFSKGTITGERTFLIPWASRLEFVNFLLGKTFFSPEAGSASQTLAQPFDSQMPYLVAQEAGWDGKINAGYDGEGNIQYQYALVQAKYAQTEVNDTINLSSQVYSLPGRHYVWMGEMGFSEEVPADDELYLEANRLNNEKGEGQDVGLVVPSAEITFERRQLLAPNFIQILDLIGCVNETEFITLPPRTDLLMGGEGRRSRLADGQLAWNITFKVQYNKNEHVRLLRASTGRYEYVKNIDSDELILGVEDLNVILQYQ